MSDVESTFQTTGCKTRKSTVTAGSTEFVERGFKLKETGVSSVPRDPDEKYSCGRSREIIRSSGVDGTEREASNLVRNQMSFDCTLMP